ncbi:hypothetical protein BU15DRAFT_89387 [Melanogaster broomeanus]|nr:hypothetical protein BU15DRAFT_89387 [Melanogaster broomeanus]
MQLVVFALGAASGAAGTVAWRRWGKRLRTAEWVTPDVLASQEVGESVADADNFKLYHTPGFGWRWPLKFRRVPTGRELKDKTIHIRIAGVDAPEGAHFGPWLKNRIEGRTIYCQLMRKDQYRSHCKSLYTLAVAVPLIPRRFLPLFLSKYWGSPLALEMLRAGTVTVYDQAGAEHGPWGRELFLRLEAEAKAAKRGIWKKGTGGETPAEYKKRYAAATVSPTSPIPLEPESKTSARNKNARDRPGWFSKLWKRWSKIE